MTSTFSHSMLSAHRYLYAVYPGYVVSNDGDKHFITAVKLMELYSVQPCLCLVVNPRNHYSSTEYSRLMEVVEELIPLRPNSNGAYKLQT